MEYLKIQDSDYGALLPFIKNKQITDINWNGKALWVDDLENGRYKVDVQLNKEFIEVFSKKISNSVNRNFNKYEPLLEAETEELRISILHEKVTNTGRSISIRKTPATRRINKQKAIQDGYCTAMMDTFMQACIQAGMSIIVCGVPGTGKTEYIKYLTQYINKEQRVITVEDNLEIRYSKINPESDSLELKVDEDFTYAKAIKASLRQRPDWIVLSEARGREVKYLLESTSTGTGCMTTLHTDTVTKIPDRIINMMGSEGKEKEDTIYSFFNVGVLVTRCIEKDKITRKISQICIFDREKDINKMQMIYADGKVMNTKLPYNFMYRFKEHGIKNPFKEVTYEAH